MRLQMNQTNQKIDSTTLYRETNSKTFRSENGFKHSNCMRDAPLERMVILITRHE